MSNSGRLIVFEGPDDVGKTTLAKEVVQLLNQKGEPAVYTSFPGQEEGTLGRFVYRLHHDPSLVPAGITPEALQTLHVAAHLDAIKRVIRPAIASGTTCVLDRFWWSTQVYGWSGNANFVFLESLIALERQYWANLRPTKLFCVLSDRPFPTYQGDKEYWRKVCQGYRIMAQAHSDDSAVQLIGNNGAIGSVLLDIMQQL